MRMIRCGPARRCCADSRRSAAPSAAAPSSASTAESWWRARKRILVFSPFPLEEEDARNLARRRPRRRHAALDEIDQLDALAAGGEGDAAVLEIEGVAAKQLMTPAGERADRRGVVGGDHLEIVGIGDQLLCHVVLLAAVLEEDAQEIDEGADAGRRLAARRHLGIVAFLQRQRAADRGEDLGPELALGDALAEAARARQLGDAGRRVRRDLEDRFVADDAVARQVALLRRVLAPRRQLAQHREEAAGSAARREAAPRRGRVGGGEGGGGEEVPLLVQPPTAAPAPPPRPDCFA